MSQTQYSPIFYDPNILGHPKKYIPADTILTPTRKKLKGMTWAYIISGACGSIQCKLLSMCEGHFALKRYDIPWLPILDVQVLD